MPPIIGDFISKHVYNSALKSWTEHPVQHSLACQFINVDGCEESEKMSFKVFYFIYFTCLSY